MLKLLITFSLVLLLVQAEHVCQFDANYIKEMIYKSEAFYGLYDFGLRYRVSGEVTERFMNKCKGDTANCQLVFEVSNDTFTDKIMGSYISGSSKLFSGTYARRRADWLDNGYEESSFTVNEEDGFVCDRARNFHQEMEEHFQVPTHNLYDIDSLLTLAGGYTEVGQKFLRDLLTAHKNAFMFWNKISVLDQGNFLFEHYQELDFDDNWKSVFGYLLYDNDEMITTEMKYHSGERTGKYFCQGKTQLFTRESGSGDVVLSGTPH